MLFGFAQTVADIGIYRQVWEALKNAIHLKQTGLYLLAYFLLQEGVSLVSVGRFELEATSVTVLTAYSVWHVWQCRGHSPEQEREFLHARILWSDARGLCCWRQRNDLYQLGPTKVEASYALHGHLRHIHDSGAKPVGNDW